MEETLDLRIVKTRRVLIDAFFDILKNKVDSKPIKVVEVCNKANISLITFYKHFKNKEGLLNYSVNDQLVNKLPIPLKLKPKNLRQLVYYLLQFFEKFYADYEKLINSCKTNQSIMQRTYFDVLLKTIEWYTFNELKVVLAGYNFFELNVITKILIGGLFNLFIKRKDNIKINATIIFNTLNRTSNSFNRIEQW